jgi:hypothetical protein
MRGRSVRVHRRLSRRARYLRLVLEVIALAALAILSLLIACRTHAGETSLPAVRSPSVAVAIDTMTEPSVVRMPYEDAAALIAVHQASIPPELRAPGGAAAAWSRWAARRTAEVRARVTLGDEDALVNLWLFGTSFTARTRLTADDLATAGSRLSRPGAESCARGECPQPRGAIAPGSGRGTRSA